MPCELTANELFRRCGVEPGQETVTDDQVALICLFLEKGNSNPGLRDYVLEKSGMDSGFWNQTLIFLTLASIRPEGTSFSPSLAVDDVWHQFILCTREYSAFCKSVGAEMIHHVPEELCDGESLGEWLPDDGIERFLNGRIPEFQADMWGESAGCSSDCRSSS